MIRKPLMILASLTLLAVLLVSFAYATVGVSNQLFEGSRSFQEMKMCG